VRTKVSLLIAISLLAAAGTLPTHASAESLTTRLARARRERAQAVVTLRSAETRLKTLMTKYREMQLQFEIVATEVVSAYAAKDAVAQKLGAAQYSLDRQAADAYKSGPTMTLEVMLGTTNPADLAAAQEYATRAFQVGAETVQQVVNLKISLLDATDRLEKRQADLRRTVEGLAGLTSQMQVEVARARDAARRAGLHVKVLEQQQRQLAEAQAAIGRRLEDLLRNQRYASLMQRLALLGPNQGRGCDIPSTLRDTGQRIEGTASWYGDDTITATGDPFDPSLFTAANKELPLNVYIRVHYNGKCAILLVNDRGPYGYGRVFDLSEGAATYLGYWSAGVVWVTADVLVPA
jgi:rare lipoprotein A (peptidoglycan hydrolase)